MNRDTSNSPSPAKQASSRAWPIKTFRDRDQWLELMLCSKLGCAAKIVAIRIALHHNVETGQCDPSLIGLVTSAGTSESTVKRSLRELEAAGWLQISHSRGGRSLHGAGYRSSYQLTIPNSVTGEPVNRSAGEPVNRAKTEDQQVRPRPDNRAAGGPQTANRTANKNSEGESPPPSKGKIRKKAARQSETPFPDNLVLDDSILETAAKVASWTPARAAHEFELWRAKSHAKGWRYRDWRAAWRTWCLQGAKFDRERAQQHGTVIDQSGNVVAMQSRQTYRRRSNTEMAFRDGGDQ
ncbi:helix-turn-helix domain-containing protein [Bradyrhizobium quebecense]|uniref:Helix-turn-helix domain-containing protein n=2 Tax=Bradyrhizobium quebecense TaxID=2748629 RepID=A0ACD3VA44_9BRAD|nr:helix-turn-helix domain-containing protein [Bradyrhizobium quebecense]UGY03263.1 helix-turn-helix domain-containing protein [Bradyrhizobium quebecense]